MRILHIDTGREMRGGQRQLMLLARGLAHRGHQQTVACRRGGAVQAEATGARIATVDITSGLLRSVEALRRLNRRQHFEIIHAHDGRGHTLAWLSSVGTPARRVASRRVSFPPRRQTIHRLKYSRTCAQVVAVSEFVRGELVSAGIPASKITVIPDGVPFPGVLPDVAERVRSRLHFGFEPGDFVIGHLGAFTAEKGQAIAIEAFRLAKSRLAQARLLLAGDGPLLAALQEKYRSQERDGTIVFPGAVDDPAPLMACLDVFVMPSLREGLGSAALHAMAFGLPVIASRAGGLAEIVKDGETGWLAAPGSPDEFAQRILAAANDEPGRVAKGARAREWARLFTDDIMVQRTEELYRELLHGEPRRP